MAILGHPQMQTISESEGRRSKITYEKEALRKSHWCDKWFTLKDYHFIFYFLPTNKIFSQQYARDWNFQSCRLHMNIEHKLMSTIKHISQASKPEIFVIVQSFAKYTIKCATTSEIVWWIRSIHIYECLKVANLKIFHTWK